ncbi:uncharacterized protein LOC143289683 [Babylonia areolata]|uniref:uncharacterized protein LOC143289683 n=1 Tax=Babylonia areolata TaxID=304850 RepID=UPI003FD5E828
MGLSLTLAAANLSLLLGWIRETGNQHICISVGVGTHWLWLMALLWMGVSCVHMLRVFISKTRLTLNQSETKKTFVRYILFTLVISGCIVILTIVVSYAVSGGASLGYGGRLCLFDTDQHPFLPLALMVPLGLVVLTNMTCFIYTVFTIRRVQHLQAQTPKGFRDILVFAKLATVTGGTWTLAVVASLINKEWLLVVAELCTASQGLLVFLSFVCNRRVWNLYRGKGEIKSTKTNVRRVLEMKTRSMCTQLTPIHSNAISHSHPRTRSTGVTHHDMSGSSSFPAVHCSF